MSEKVTSVDAPLLTSKCFCYLDWYWSGHAKTFILPIVVTLVSTCGLLLLLLWRLQPSLFAGRRYCALARLRQGPVEWYKVLMKVFRSFVQSKWERSQDLLCVPSCVIHSWQILMDNWESELLQPTQPEGLDEDVWHWTWETGQQKSSHVGCVANRKLCWHSFAGTSIAVKMPWHGNIPCFHLGNNSEHLEDVLSFSTPQ